jgi:surfeit locus 1 family protein
MKRIPILATLIVIAAVALMIRLGFWQLERADEKAELLARFSIAGSKAEIAFPAISSDDTLLFRKAAGFCLEPVSEIVTAGRNTLGQSGWRHITACRTGAEGPGMVVDIGWSADFKTRSGWKGGTVRGTIAPKPDHRSLISMVMGKAASPGIMLVATTPAPRLKPSAPPDLNEIPNNHLAYAVQWFLFAGIAALIFGIALYRRRKI